MIFELFINCEIPTLVSEEDFDHLNGYNFRLSDWGYLVTDQKPYRHMYLHKIVALRMGLDISKIIDHKDRNRLNNQRYNLREATISQNNINRERDKVLGVNENSIGKYIARIQVNSKNNFLGCFNTKEEAFVARREAEIKYFGEFANV